MAECASCHQAIDDDAKFCSACGAPVTRADSLSPFELGKMAALETIKADIRKWALGSVAVLGPFFVVLGYLGVNDLIHNSMNDKVDQVLRPRVDEIARDTKTQLHDELAEMRKQMQSFTDDIKGQLNRELTHANSEVDGMRSNIESKVQDLRDTLHHANQDRSQLASILDNLNKGISNAADKNKRLDEEQSALQKRADEMERTAELMNISTFVAKMSYDFYHIRELRASIRIKCRAIESEDLLNDTGDEIEFGKKVGDDNTRYAQFHSVGSRVRLWNGSDTATRVTVGWSNDEVLYTPYEDRIVGQHIRDLDNNDIVIYKLVSRRFAAAPDFWTAG